MNTQERVGHNSLIAILEAASQGLSSRTVSYQARSEGAGCLQTR